MAVYQDPRLMDQKNKTDVLDGSVDATQQESSQVAPPTGNQQGVAPQESVLPQTAKPIKSPARSGMFTNIKNYVEKNKPASENMAKAIGDKVQKSADIARKNIQNVQGQFTTLKDQSTLANRESAIDEVTQAAQSAANMQQKAVDTSEQDKRLQSILDAQYKGPETLRELGTYQGTQRKTLDAQRLVDQLESGPQDRQELLKTTLERPGSRYTQGAKKLDELLFSQGDPQKILSERRKNIGNVTSDLSQAEVQARQEAADRMNEILGIRSDARTALTDVSQQRQKEVEDYLTSQLGAGQDLARYYSNILSGSSKGLELGGLEAETLGVQSGTGLYRLLSDPNKRQQLIADLDRSGQLNRDQLIRLDQQGQLAELQRLNELSKDYGVADSGLGYRNIYTDAEKAGSQSALDALNLNKMKDYLTEAEQDFRKSAGRDVTGVGRGAASYKKGWFRGRGKVRKTAYEKSNLKNILQKQGYDFNSDPSSYINEANTDILKDLANIQRHAKGETLDLSDGQTEHDILSGLAGEDSALWEKLGLGDYGKILTGGGVASLASKGVEGVGKGIQDINSGVEQAIFGGNNNTLGNLLTDPVNVVGKGIQDLGREATKFNQNFFGGGKSKARKKATADAKRRAIKDLQNKLQSKLRSSGFSNRINVANTEKTKERQKNLLDLLGNIDTSNINK
jgi:hypothetical protein